MKKIPLILMALVLLAMLGVAPAAALTIGTLSNGTGTATLDGFGQPTSFAFSGHFAFDNVTLYDTGSPYGWQTLAWIFGDGGQYSFSANTASTLHAYDVNGYNYPLPGTIYDKGSVKWGVNGTYGGTALYGQAMTLSFSGGNSGSAGGIYTSDGYAHWYYGYDETTSPTPGMTLMSDYGLPAASYFLGQYAITQQDGNNISYIISGEFNTVPIPGTLVLLGSGLAGLAFYRRRRAIGRKG